MSESRWICKECRFDCLETELNAFHEQGYTIRWMFRTEYQNTSVMEIVAEKVTP